MGATNDYGQSEVAHTGRTIGFRLFNRRGNAESIVVCPECHVQGEGITSFVRPITLPEPCARCGRLIGPKAADRA